MNYVQFFSNGTACFEPNKYNNSAYLENKESEFITAGANTCELQSACYEGNSAQTYSIKCNASQDGAIYCFSGDGYGCGVQPDGTSDCDA